MFDKAEVLPIATDHAGFTLKAYLIEKLTAKGYHVKDFGPFSEDRVDYPDFIHPLARAINDKTYRFGIILCGSGQGASITANKYAGVRAALCWDKEQAALSRKHNNANIVSLPARFIDFDVAVEIVEIFLQTEFEGGRHTLRVEKISRTQ
ncbi:MAG: ribose 5-phosphate isomerase B [Bacteroidales bacterium]|nr:ribose 5-phosphate isomerase B [Bacteroidales bacterium]